MSLTELSAGRILPNSEGRGSVCRDWCAVCDACTTDGHTAGEGMKDLFDAVGAAAQEYHEVTEAASWI